MSFFHLCRCSHTLHSHSILEFSASGFCSTVYRRGKWDLGRSEDLFIMVTPCATCFLPKFATAETEKWGLHLQKSTAGHPRLMPEEFSDKNSKLCLWQNMPIDNYRQPKTSNIIPCNLSLRQRNQRSNSQHLVDHRKSKRIPGKHLLLLHWYDKAFHCVDHNKGWKIPKRDGNTRPPYRPPTKPAWRSRSNS